MLYLTSSSPMLEEAILFWDFQPCKAVAIHMHPLFQQKMIAMQHSIQLTVLPLCSVMSYEYFRSDLVPMVPEHPV